MDIKPADVRRAAMDLLARREHARGELASKLTRKFGGHEDLVSEEIDKLTQEGLQSDDRLAESFIRSRAGRGQGPVKIRAELRGRGVADDAINLAMETADIDWFDVAATAGRKKFGDSPAQDIKEKAKRSRFLQQRGFTYDQISSIFDS